MLSHILQRALADIEAWCRDHPEDAAYLRPSLAALRNHISQMIQFVQQPTAADLGLDERSVRTGTQH